MNVRARTAAELSNGVAHPTILPYEWMSDTQPVNVSLSRKTRATAFDFDVHRTFEVGILLVGSEERCFGRTIRGFSAGDAWCIPAWEPHGWHTVAPPTEELTIHFIPGFLGDARISGVSWLSFFALPAGSRPTIASPQGQGSVLAIGRDLADELAAQQLGWTDMVRCGVLRLLTIFARDSGLPYNDRRWKDLPPNRLQRIMPAIELVYEDVSTRLPLDKAAEACGVSTAWFRELFRETMGVTYGRFEHRARLAHATRLLLGTDEPVDAVGEQTGFADGSHFHRAFHRHYGCTPTDFRTRGRPTAPGPASAARR